MARPTEHALDTGELQLHYAEAGDGDSFLLLLHGLGARWQVFGPVLPALTSRWHVLAPDLRGHGQSGRTPGRYGLPNFVGDVHALLDVYGAERVLLWGHSLGGWIGLHLAATRPERVSALVVADSAIYPEHLDPDAAFSYLADLPLALRSLARSLQQLDPAVMSAFRSGELLDGYDADALLPRVICPTLLLQADPDRDGLMTDAAAQRAIAALPRAVHRRFDGIGHGLHVEDAARVLEAALPFLDEHARPQP